MFSRLLQVTVFFRHVFAENDMKTSELFGFPVFINLPSPVEGIKMHEIIKGITPSHLQNCSHTLAVTGYMVSKGTYGKWLLGNNV